MHDIKFTPELREKARTCKTPEELMELEKSEGYKLSEEELETASSHALPIS